MWNEHFGISVVEMMAAGLVIVAHKSGGPLMDIVSGTGRETSSTSSDVSDSSIGYLAESVEEYADAIVSIVDNYDKAERISLQNHARESTLRFSDEIFVTKMVYEFEYMVKLLKKNRRN